MPRESTLTVADFIALYPPAFRGGGPIRSNFALVTNAPDSLTTLVITGDRDLGESEPLPVARNVWVQRDGASVRYVTTASARFWLRAMFEVRKRKPQLLYFNSFFNRSFTFWPLLLWRFGFWGSPKILLAPRGEFGDGALTRRTNVKTLYIKIFRALGIHKSIVWHSTAPHESDSIRRIWGGSANIIERSQDTNLPTKAVLPVSRENGNIKLVFVGRVTDLKGPAIALEALKVMRSKVTFDIYGPWEDEAYLERCRALARELPSNVSVEFRGAVEHEAIAGIFSNHDVFVFPSAGENFGHVFAEALSRSCLVMSTPYTPWTETLLAGGGMVVEDRSVEKWEEALARIDRLNSTEVESRRLDAGQAYDRWAAHKPSSHLWELALFADPVA